MLKLFRHKNVVKMVLWGLLILILPAFVFWGTGSLSRSKDGRPAYAGKIGGKKVSFEEFANSVTSARCQLLFRYHGAPETLNSMLKNKPFIGRLAWDRLIMLKEAKKYHRKVTDKDVVTYIRSLPVFTRQGKFDEKFYSYLLKNYIGLEPRRFEEQMRENIAINLLTDSLTSGIKVTDDEIKKLYKKENKRFKISYLLFPSHDFLEKANVDDEEVKAYYEAHKGEFRLRPKEGGPDQTPKAANFDEVKEMIRMGLAENKAKAVALQHAEEMRWKILGFMEKNAEPFEKAVIEIGVDAKETPIFAKSDYLEGIGEAAPIAEAAMELEKDEISKPIVTNKGVIIFRVILTEDHDEEKLQEEKDEYAKKVLNNKKEIFLADWLKAVEFKATLDIDLSDYEKYYRP